MEEVLIRQEGRAGRITLNRPKALNALTHGMCTAIETALRRWREDADLALVVIDGMGQRAFCAGGDIAEMYEAGRRGDYAYGRRFWTDEYRMNAYIAAYAKPVVSFLHGYTMGGGVGVGCHASHRIVGESTRIAMPECGIGLVPDVGGSFLLARAPGRLGEYLGTTGERMTAGDAILTGFADACVPEANWDALKREIIATGDPAAIATAAHDAPDAALATLRPEIDRLFSGTTMAEIESDLAEAEGDLAEETRKALGAASPLSTSATVEILHRLRPAPALHDALGLEFRFACRAMQHGDFLEGIRAAIIDKDRTPRWRHPNARAVTAEEVGRMLMPLDPAAPTFKEDET